MVRSYQCPGCSAPMEFNGEKQKMVCEHCGTELTVEELEEISKFNVDTGEQVEGDFTETGETADFVTFKCSSCGAEILTDENTSATFCSFCGRPNMVQNRLTGALAPKHLIPFKINKQSAVEKYREWAKKGLFTPSLFSSNATIEKITGMYVPFWMYDYNARMNLTADCTKVRHSRKGDYEYTYTDHYIVTRDVEAEYDKLPTDASEKMPDDVMDKVEPYNYNEITDFEMPYLSGYYSEKYNYTAEQLSPRAEKRIRQYILDTTRSTISGYATVNITRQNSMLSKLKAEYMLMPVWILNLRYNDKDFLFAMNGQTGKIVADRPLSKGKMIGWYVGLTIVITAILFLVGRFL